MNKDASHLPHQRLREARHHRGWSQQYIADRLDTTVVTVKRWERGFQSPGPHYRLKLCTLFEKSAEELGIGPENPPLLVQEEASLPVSEGVQVSTLVERFAPVANEPGMHVAHAKDATAALVAPSVLRQVFRNTSYPVTQSQQNRLQMLRRLYHTYSTALTQSLQGAAWIDVGLSQIPDAVRNMTTLLFRSTRRAECPLPPGTSIVQVYEDAEHELLILGEPGAGKSMLLLYLALRLVGNAMQDDAYPLPILFPLSSWAVKRPTLYAWIKEQLTFIYNIPPRLAQQWMQEEHILPLLDGFDEMEEAARPACIRTINVYHCEHLVPLVVCSRTDAYMAAARSEQLTLHTAVVVQPLSADLVETHLMTTGHTFAALRTHLRENSVLQTLTATPLMLQILMLTYQNTPIQDLAHQEGPLRQQLWTDYVQRMLSCKGDAKRYPPAITNKGLSWLARQMRQQNQTIFFQEQVQSDWLELEHTRRAYRRWAVLLPGAFGAGLLGVFASTLLFSSYFTLAVSVLLFMLAGIVLTMRGNATTEQSQKKSYRSSWLPLCVCVVGGLGAAVISILTRDGRAFYHIENGFSYAVASALLSILLSKQREYRESSRCFLSALNGVKYWFFTKMNMYRRDGLNIGLSCAVGFGLHEFFRRGLWYALGEGLRYGLLLGIAGILLSVLMQVFQVKKVTVEPEGRLESADYPKWSWRSARDYLFTWKHLKNVFVIALSVALTMGVSVLIRMIELQTSFNWQKESETIIGYGISVGLVVLSTYWLQQGYRGGLVQDLLPETRWLKQRRRIRSSLYSALLISCISATVGWLSYILSYNAHVGMGGGGSHFLFLFGFLFGVSGGIVSGLLYGGLVCLRYLVLRILLWRTCVFPWNTTSFLDDAADRILLRQVGNGYSFAHRLLMDYFADLDTGY